MQCLDEPSAALNIYGEINTSPTKHFKFEVSACRGRESCKTQAEIDAFLLDKSVLIAQD